MRRCDASGSAIPRAAVGTIITLQLPDNLQHAIGPVQLRSWERSAANASETNGIEPRLRAQSLSVTEPSVMRWILASTRRLHHSVSPLYCFGGESAAQYLSLRFPLRQRDFHIFLGVKRARRSQERMQ